jgi:hypothetical protein
VQRAVAGEPTALLRGLQPATSPFEGTARRERVRGNGMSKKQRLPIPLRGHVIDWRSSFAIESNSSQGREELEQSGGYCPPTPREIDFGILVRGQYPGQSSPACLAVSSQTRIRKTLLLATLLGSANASTLALPRTSRPPVARISPISCTPSLLRGSEPQTRICGNRPELSGTFDFAKVRVL